MFGAAIIVQSDVSGMNHGRSANDIDAGSDETRNVTRVDTDNQSFTVVLAANLICK